MDDRLKDKIDKLIKKINKLKNIDFNVSKLIELIKSNSSIDKRELVVYIWNNVSAGESIKVRIISECNLLDSITEEQFKEVTDIDNLNILLNGMDEVKKVYMISVYENDKVKLELMKSQNIFNINIFDSITDEGVLIEALNEAKEHENFPHIEFTKSIIESDKYSKELKIQCIETFDIINQIGNFSDDLKYDVIKIVADELDSAKLKEILDILPHDKKVEGYIEFSEKLKSVVQLYDIVKNFNNEVTTQEQAASLVEKYKDIINRGFNSWSTAFKIEILRKINDFDLSVYKSDFREKESLLSFIEKLDITTAVEMFEIIQKKLPEIQKNMLDIIYKKAPDEVIIELLNKYNIGADTAIREIDDPTIKFNMLIKYIDNLDEVYDTVESLVKKNPKLAIEFFKLYPERISEIYFSKYNFDDDDVRNFAFAFQKRIDMPILTKIIITIKNDSKKARTLDGCLTRLDEKSIAKIIRTIEEPQLQANTIKKHVSLLTIDTVCDLIAAIDDDNIKFNTFNELYDLLVKRKLHFMELSKLPLEELEKINPQYAQAKSDKFLIDNLFQSNLNISYYTILESFKTLASIEKFYDTYASVLSFEELGLSIHNLLTTLSLEIEKPTLNLQELIKFLEKYEDVLPKKYFDEIIKLIALDLIKPLQVIEFLEKYENKMSTDDLYKIFNEITNLEDFEEINIQSEKIKACINEVKVRRKLVERVENSNSLEIQRLHSQLVEALKGLSVDEAMRYVDQIENMFLRNNIPMGIKLYQVFAILHPTFDKMHIYSPTLVEENGLSKDEKYELLIRDMLKVTFASNPYEMYRYLESTKNEMDSLRKLIAFKNQYPLARYDGLNANDKKSIDKILQIVASWGYVCGFGEDTPPKDMYEMLNTDLVYVIENWIINAFNYSTGQNFTSIDEIMKSIKENVQQITERNKQRVLEPFRLEQGDLIKGVADYDKYLYSMLLYGVNCQEMLGANANSDFTNLDTDFSMIRVEHPSIDDAMLGTTASIYGSTKLWMVLKNTPGRFNLTSYEKNGQVVNSPNFNPTKVDLRMELFKINGPGNDNFGIRSGVPSTEIDFMICEEYEPWMGYSVAMNGFYIPIVDKQGSVVFTPTDYENIRQKMQGMDYFYCSDIELSSKVKMQGIDEFVKLIRDDKPITSKKLSLVRQHLKVELTKCGYSIRDSLDDDLLSRKLELIGTGSTERGNNTPGDCDFDYMLRIDTEKYTNEKEMSKIREGLLTFLRSHGGTPVAGDCDTRIRYEGVKIDGIEEPISIDISFVKKVNKIEYTSDVALGEKMHNIDRIYGSDADYVRANIVLAKKVLKLAGVYKKMDHGIGGIGVENWILQHDGSFLKAIETFIQTYENLSEKGLSEEEFGKQFMQAYPIFDFGENFYRSDDKSDKYGGHDNYIEFLFMDKNNKMLEPPRVHIMYSTLKLFIEKYKNITDIQNLISEIEKSFKRYNEIMELIRNSSNLSYADAINLIQTEILPSIQNRSLDKNSAYAILDEILFHLSKNKISDEQRTRLKTMIILQNEGKSIGTLKEFNAGGHGIMYKYNEGEEQYIIKPGITIYYGHHISAPLKSEVVLAASKIQKMISGERYIPFEKEDGMGLTVTKQPYIENNGNSSSIILQIVNGEIPQGYTEDDAQRILDQLLNEYVVDYLLCNFDAYSRNFIIDLNGNLRGIDKEQSFKFVTDKESLGFDFSYNPNDNDIIIYKQLFDSYRQGKVKLNFGIIEEAIARSNNISIDDYIEIIYPYVKEAAEKALKNKYTEEYKKANPGTSNIPQFEISNEEIQEYAKELIKVMLERKEYMENNMLAFIEQLKNQYTSQDEVLEQDEGKKVI